MGLYVTLAERQQFCKSPVKYARANANLKGDNICNITTCTASMYMEIRMHSSQNTGGRPQQGVHQ
eukprot:2524781-Pleurochrysis_carterae.AAC.1